MLTMAPKEPKAQQAWRERLMRSGYLIGAILLHLVIFLLVATIVIWRAPQPPAATAEFKPTSVKIPPPPPQPPPSGSSASNPEMELTEVTVPVIAPPRTFTTTSPSTFAVDSSKLPAPALSHLPAHTAGPGMSPGNGPGSNPWETPGGTTNLLTGYFYDLKQTPDRRETGMDQGRWREIMTRFVSKGWADSVLAPYYKSKSPIYTDAYAISTRVSEEAPREFKLENEVQPALWAIHYHAKVLAPEPGDYRFVGCGDDLLAVSINGALVLDAGWVPVSTREDLHKTYPITWSPINAPFDKDENNSFIKIGAVFHVDMGTPVDMDVLIGDWGGKCYYYLMIEKVGKTYEKLPDGTPKLPFFQLTSHAAPTFGDGEEHPPYSMTPEPWQPVDKL